MSGPTLSLAAPAPSVGDMRRRDRRTWCSTYLVCMVATLLVALIAVKTAPTQFSLALVLLLIIIGPRRHPAPPRRLPDRVLHGAG